MPDFIGIAARRWRTVAALVGCFAVGVLAGAVTFGKLLHVRFRYEPQWGDVATWLAVFVAATGGWIALSQLRQQGTVIAGEAERNKRRDLLLDGQLAELQRRQVFLEREQAGKVELTRVSVASDRTIEMQVANGSGRPIWDLACASVGADGHVVARADLVAELHLMEPADGRPAYWNDYPGEAIQGWRLPVMRANGRAGFSFGKPSSALPDPVAVRFTDDDDLHWELGENLRLRPLGDRSDW